MPCHKAIMHNLQTCQPWPLTTCKTCQTCKTCHWSWMTSKDIMKEMMPPPTMQNVGRLTVFIMISWVDVLWKGCPWQCSTASNLSHPLSSHPWYDPRPRMEACCLPPSRIPTARSCQISKWMGVKHQGQKQACWIRRLGTMCQKCPAPTFSFLPSCLIPCSFQEPTIQWWPFGPIHLYQSEAPDWTQRRTC